MAAMLNIAASFIAITALFAWLNRRFIGLPSAIGVMAIALVLSLVLLVLNRFGISGLYDIEASLMASIDFSDLLMQGMLSVLLYAGARDVDLHALRSHRAQVLALAVAGTAVNALLIALAAWWLLPLLGLGLPFAWCLVFGTLIAPTDPVSVLGILRKAGAPKSLEVMIVGESLFNDGVAVVLFSLALGIAASGEAPTFAHAASLLLREAGGGLALGLALGWGSYFLLKSIDSVQDEALISIATVVGGYALALRLEVSPLLAVVMAGLVVGNYGRAYAMSPGTRSQLDAFWELVDALANGVLFVLIGIEVITIDFSPAGIVAAILLAILVVLARLFSTGLPAAVLSPALSLPHGSWKVLTWGGLRGGVSVALALSLHPGPERDLIVGITYLIVALSILVQGLSIGWLTRRAVRGG